MRTFSILASVGAALCVASCAFLLDFDELQDQTGADASVGGSAGAAGGGGAAGSAGSAGNAGTSGAAGSAGAGVNWAELAKTTAGAICGKLEQCFGAPAMPLIFGDSDCTQTLGANMANSTFAQVSESVKVGKMKVNPSQLTPCLEEFKKLPCNEVSVDFPAACRKALEGTKAVGQACAHALECTPGNYCAVQTTCPGKCAPFRTSGQTCSETDPCVAGFGCTNGKCTRLAAVGEPCLGTTGNDCEVGALCFGDESIPTPKDGTCVATKGVFSVPINQECSYWLGAINPATFKLCNAGVCPIFEVSPTTRVCSGFLVTPGSGCKISLPDPCPSGQFCNGTVCTDLPINGANCAPATTVKGRCKAGHSCNGSTCDVQRPNGEFCGSHAQCFSGECDLGGTENCVVPGCPVTP